MTNLKKMTVNMMSLSPWDPNNERFNNEKVYNEIIHLNVVFSGGFETNNIFLYLYPLPPAIQIII